VVGKVRNDYASQPSHAGYVSTKSIERIPIMSPLFRFLEAMRERLSKYSLTLHPDKTRLLAFGRFAADQRARMGLGKPETFNFLGFTFISGKSREGKFLVRRKSRRDRVKAKLKEIKVALRANMHKPIPEQGTWLGQVVRGYFAYHAVPTNLGTLVAFHHYVSDLWLRTLRRRSQKDRKAWTDMTKMAAQWLPRPRVQHPWPNQRFAVKYPRWKPDAGKAACPVLCGGRVVIRVPTAIFISSLSP
jgi:RNA-directed DNA polymerase